MRRALWLLPGICILFWACDRQQSAMESRTGYITLSKGFAQPDEQYGVNCWWWWLNGNVSTEAITRDLEAMWSRNFQGAMIFDAGGHDQRGNKNIPAGPLFGTEAWNALFVHALDEARRLGLEMGFNIQSGWNLGGPRVTPQYAAKQLTYTERRITGGSRIQVDMKEPHSRQDFYRDVALLAFPVHEQQAVDTFITDLHLKLGFRELGGSAPDCRFLLGNTPRAVREPSGQDSAFIIQKHAVVDLTSRLNTDGTLFWDAPAGTWSILRIGYTCTDAHVSTSSGDWQGNVLDYMSVEAFDFYWSDVVVPILEAAGDHVGTTLKYMETDSWECGGMNWTDDFAKEFQAYRGYDLTDYLPVIAGYIVDDVQTSNAFLADFRKTLGDLVAYNHYAVFQKYAHRNGMGIQPESAGPHAGPLDGIKNYGFSDIVMSEFWSPSPHRPRPNNRFFLKQASSAAHIYGVKIVGAESFTTIGPHWNDALWRDQKSAFDHEICAGLNRMYFHTFTCSPPEMGLPGQEYFAGTHVNPQVTWWHRSGPFIDYMHRVQSIVQNGKFVADVLYYYGDHVPNVFPHKHWDPAGAMPGFDYDVTDETIFLQLTVKNGRIVVPGGLAYRVLVLPDHRVLSYEVLEQLESLVHRGAQVIGYKPERLVSLVGGPEAQVQFDALVDRLWGEAPARTGERSYGKGRVAWGVTARDYLISRGVPPDFALDKKNEKAGHDYIHYTFDDGHVYFVSNQTEQSSEFVCTFRVSGLQPELWDPLTGEIRPARAFTQKDGLISMPLHLEPYGAVMVVFHTKIGTGRQGTASRNHPVYSTMQGIDGPWEVHFDPEWGGPGTVTFPHLVDWSTHPHDGIRYYSGTAVYEKTFVPAFELNNDKAYCLQLGAVADVGIARVVVNGQDQGITWTKPFRVDITQALKEGDNILRVEVTNSWYNRVAGDEILDEGDGYTSTNIVLGHDYRGRPVDAIALEPSGLLGPVTIQMAVME